MNDYKGNAMMPIVAFDFDGVVALDTEGADYPSIKDECENVGIHKLMDFLSSLGVVVGIWTCREGADQVTMATWLAGHRYHIDFINDTSKYAPYEYNPRKIFAHLYVDDRGVGYGCFNISSVILRYFLKYTLKGVFNSAEIRECVRCFTHNMPPKEWMIERIKYWKN